MLIELINQLKKIFASIIFIAMTVPSFTQDNPSFDRIKTSAGDVDLHFIGHGSLLFSLGDYAIYVDPVRSSGSYDNSAKADLILVTHEHYDHLDNDLIKTLRKATTVLICNKNAADNIPWARIMKAGDKITLDKVTIEAVPAYNIVNMRAPGQPYHPKGVGNGYILTIGDTRIYVAGDTENTPEMKALKNIDVAFLPMNLPYTMTPEMVADAAESFHPKILYPYHYGDTNTDKLVNLLKNTDIIVRIRNLR